MKYLIWRIVGNDLPPRHARGATLEQVRFVLDHEPQFPECERRWLLNRIVDDAARENLLAALSGEVVHTIPFDDDAYRRGVNRHDRLRAAIGINQARNDVLERGFADAEYVMPADAGIFFTEPAWQSIVDTIESYEERGERRDYFAVPMERTQSFEQVLETTRAPEPVDEPQLFFRRGAPLRFDESLRYGRRDKVELLLRLGRVPGYLVDDRDAPHVYSQNEALCPDAGFVSRMPAGRIDAGDEDPRIRGRLRVESLERFTTKLDERTGRPAASEWERIDPALTVPFDVEGDLASVLTRCAASTKAGGTILNVGRDPASAESLEAGARRASARVVTIRPKRRDTHGIDLPPDVDMIDRLVVAADVPQLECVANWLETLPRLARGGILLFYAIPDVTRERAWSESYRDCIRGNDELRALLVSDTLIVAERR